MVYPKDVALRKANLAQLVLNLRSLFAYFLLMRLPTLIFLGLLSANMAFASDPGWQPLFDGKDLTGWDTEMMNIPDPTWDVPGLKRDAGGTYVEALGKNRDPLHVFTVTTVDGQPAIHVSGQGFGVLMTTGTFGNVHVHLEIKWGDRKWGKKIGKPFDTGLLYFCHSEAGVADKTWPRGLEFQICQNEFGDLYALASQVTVPAVMHTGSNGRPLYVYDPNGTPTLFIEQKPIGNHCAHIVDPEAPKGQWNTVDLFTLNGDSIHVVNGKVVMRLHNAQRLDGDTPAPLTSGKICLQTEGGECYFRDVEVESITEFPRELAAPKM
jgi:hypothetical protein